MFRALILATLFLAAARPIADQAQGVLQIKVVLLDSNQQQTAVPRHALLISDSPPTAAPRRVFTRADGTIEITLAPGVYTVESDRPVAFNGKAYQWTAMVDVPAGRNASLELTEANAEVGALAAAAEPSTAAAPAAENDPSFLLNRWQDSVVAVWTATTRASGFVVDTRGVVVTSQRAIGDAVTAEVQFSPSTKVAARVVAADAVRDVAVLRVDAASVASIKPMALECTAPATAPLADDQDIFAIGAPLRAPKNLVPGSTSRYQKRLIADFSIDTESTGGPVFTTAGAVAGLTSIDRDDRVDDIRIVGAAEVCEVLKSAEGKLTAGEGPGGARLPVEPEYRFPADALDVGSKRRNGVSIPYQLAASDFDVSFITPVLVHVAERRWQQSSARDRGPTPRAADEGRERMRLLTDFGHWSRYFEEFPPVLLVRVTPKLVEGFWAKVARGAASTQGVALPPLKSLTSGFARLRAFCGQDEVVPIHPFKLAHRINEREFTHEGLYVFDPGALGPQCGSVRLTLYSEKDPDKADARVVDPKVVQLFWGDFDAYRAQAPQGAR